ncbi:NADH:ubiquinone oxidoreductase17.2kDa subunit [Penicillium daleae]|uniref:NADH:ubiquinone oxidoreductase17.2kDa subunit n=1 Tax=Penicillium daleae TaxID=63821 RepID=A0AAD6C8H8_9EURO|nr:NADH:ubiquinone oxidoreductase17.2kDa subunit [Penicillium daleae]KAJ5454514.1 NADH:ubiquinone oxidoreductase17.2kDa subunit [Penicillium daleae]
MVNSLWFKWKSLRLPWRRSFLVGHDLAGNTFWEFKDVANATRFRRIVKFDPKTHYGDVQVTPQWHQWLRYVRQDPPSLEEQQQDLIRQAQIKELARLADERWASKPSFLDKPNTRQTLPPTETSEPTVNPATESRQDAPAPTPSTSTPEPTASKPKPLKEDPWAKANPGNPGDTWQPESWTPSSKR